MKATMTDMQQRIAVLRCVDLFSGLDDEAYRYLAERCNDVIRPANDTVYHRDDEANSVFVIVDGVVRLEGEGRSLPVHLELRKRGDHLGVASMITGVPRSATAHVVEHCTLLKISKEHFDVQTRYHSCITANVIEHLMKRVTELSGFVEVLQLKSSNIKVAYIILRHFKSDPKRLSRRAAAELSSGYRRKSTNDGGGDPEEFDLERNAVLIQESDIADALNVTVNVVSKAMCILAKEHFIERLARGAIAILDVEKLELYCRYEPDM